MEELIIDSTLDSNYKNFTFILFKVFNFTLIKNGRSVGATGTNKGALTKLNILFIK